MNKRITAIKLGLAYPHYTAQVHYDPDDDSLLSLAVAKTSDIYAAYDMGLYRICNPHGKNKEVFFRDVSWKLMKENGFDVYDWYRDATCVPTTFLDVKKMEYVYGR